MKIMLIVVLLLLSSWGPASAEEWDATDKTMLGTLIGLSVVDCLQTLYIFNHVEYRERNGVIRRGVDEFGKGFIPMYFAGFTLLSYWVTDSVLPEYRKPVLGVLSGIQLHVVYDNDKAGVGLSFRF